MSSENIRRMWEAAAERKSPGKRLLTTSELTDPKRYAHLSPDEQKANVDAVKANMAKPENQKMQAIIDARAARKNGMKD